MQILPESNLYHQKKYFYIYRPHIPITKLNVSESYDTYMSRSYKVTKDILAACKNKGQCQINVLSQTLYGCATSQCSVCLWFLLIGNNVLIVAHASSLEACTRQLQGLTPHNAKEFVQVVRKVCFFSFYHSFLISFLLLFVLSLFFCPFFTL